jgi:PleD family two-component response regulator
VGGRLPAIVLANDDFDSRLAAARAGASLLLTGTRDPEHIVTAFSSLPRQVNEERVVALAAGTELDRELLLLESERIRVTRATKAQDVIAALERARPQALLIAARVCGVGAAELCALVRAVPQWHNLPVFVLGANNDQESLDAYRAGADDVFFASTADDELLARLRVRFDRSLSYQEQSNRDVLTGIFTRRAFIEAMAARLAEARRAKQHLSLCLCDLDKFKQINDTHGHSVGDEVLATFGLVLDTSFRIEDLRARWGGEEFITAFSGEWADSAREILSRAPSRFARPHRDGNTRGPTA